MDSIDWSHAGENERGGNRLMKMRSNGREIDGMEWKVAHCLHLKMMHSLLACSQPADRCVQMCVFPDVVVLGVRPLSSSQS